MRWILTLVFLLLTTSLAAAQARCDKYTAFQHINATGPVEVAVGKENQRVYVCGYMLVQKGNTLDFTLLTGKGPNCTLERKNVYTLELPNDLALVNRIETVGPVGEPGYSVCIQTTGSNAKLGGVIYWAQF